MSDKRFECLIRKDSFDCIIQRDNKITIHRKESDIIIENVDFEIESTDVGDCFLITKKENNES